MVVNKSLEFKDGSFMMGQNKAVYKSMNVTDKGGKILMRPQEFDRISEEENEEQVHPLNVTAHKTVDSIVLDDGHDQEETKKHVTTKAY